MKIKYTIRDSGDGSAHLVWGVHDGTDSDQHLELSVRNGVIHRKVWVWDGLKRKAKWVKATEPQPEDME